jgi:diguanylate cyclase (GGDEF)-like protein
VNALPVLNPVVLLSGLLVAVYTTFVACECVHGNRVGATKFKQISARLSVASALGTGLWAAYLMLALSHRSAEPIALEWPLALLSWLSSVAAAGAAMEAAAAPPANPSKRLLPVLVCAAFLLLLQAAGDAAQGVDIGTSAQHGAARAATALCIGAVLVLALRSGAHGAAAAGVSLQRIAVVLLLGLLLVGQEFLSAEPGAAPARRHIDGSELPSPLIALLAGIGAAFVLTLARTGARVERLLSGKAQQLESSRRVASQDLHELAYRDPLTRLSNRRRFDRKLAAAVTLADAAHARLTLLFIDLDGFKPVNDCYGHGSGDRVLVAVGERLRRIAPKGATIARIGGDEFAVLLPETLNTGEASLLASRILVALGSPFAVSGTELTLSASIGIAFYPDCGGADKIVASGDAAMYAAKRSGGSTFAFFEPGMGGDARDQAELMLDLRRAAELRQLELHYQPKIDAASGQVTAVEALLRWNHPQRGMVGPDVFIPLAERIGLIGSIGDWVLDEACRQMSEWQTEGLRMRVAINLSARQLVQPGLSGRIQSVLERHGVAPELLTCEVTESTAMSDTRSAHRALTLLGRLGVRVSIDDFGTGYSSLSYLRQLPATELKIDRSFVSDLDSSDDARAIVQAVIHMAHALDLTVVAEGVETAAQRDILQALGCDEFQGYLFAKALPAATVLKWAQAERDQPRTFRPSLFNRSEFATLS